MAAPLPSPAGRFIITIDRLGVLDIHMPQDCSPADLPMLAALKTALDAVLNPASRVAPR